MTPRLRWLVALGAVVVFVVIAVVGAYFWASAAAERYEDDFDRWSKTKKSEMTAATVNVPGAFGYTDTVSELDQRNMAEACNELLSLPAKIETAADSQPHAPRLPFRWLSDSYDQVVKKDARRTDVVEAYLEPAVKTLRQMGRDCRFEGKILEHDVRRDALAMKLEDVALPKSDPSCGEPEGCIPHDPATQMRFAKFLARMNEAERRTLPLLRSRECSRTSYGSTCDRIAASLERALDVQDRYIDEVRKLGPVSSGYAVNTAASNADRSRVKHDKLVIRLLEQELPGIEKAPRFKDTPALVDTVFESAAHVAVEKMHDLRLELAGID